MNGWYTYALLVGSLIYILPTLIALYRHATSVRSIAVLNLFLGWTLILWFGASVWAMVDKPDSK